MISILTSSLIETMLYIPAIWGVYISFRIARFPDLSTDNVIGFGSIIGVFFFTNFNNLPLTIISVLALGFVVGVFTSFLFSIGNISKLLSGILTFTILYSVNLKIFGKPNIPYENLNISIIYMVVIDIILFLVLSHFIKTNIGLSIKVYSTNPLLIKEFNISDKILLLIALGISTSMITLSGFISSVYFGFADVGIGIGILINAVAAILLGEYFKNILGKINIFLALALGSFVYNFLITTVTYAIGYNIFSSTDSKLISSVLIIVLLLLNRKKTTDLFGI